MSELKQLQDLSGIDGWAPEYWSPPPAWKASGSYYGGTLASFNESFLEAFADSVQNDVVYLQNNGLRIKWWGLQNEPMFEVNNITAPCKRPKIATPVPVLPESAPSPEPGRFADKRKGAIPPCEAKWFYGQCCYSQCAYYYTFQACAKKIRALDPTIRIHANSNNGQVGASPIAQDPYTLALVDAWTWHTINANSSRTFRDAPYNYGKLDFTNEMEYQPGSPLAGSAYGSVSNVNIFLNTLTFKNSPTGVMMLHASKPTTNMESLGYEWQFSPTHLFPFVNSSTIDGRGGGFAAHPTIVLESEASYLSLSLSLCVCPIYMLTCAVTFTC